MASNQLATSEQLATSIGRRAWRAAFPQIKRQSQAIPGGEIEVLEQLGELPRRPREPSLDPSLTRWRWL